MNVFVAPCIRHKLGNSGLGRFLPEWMAEGNTKDKELVNLAFATAGWILYSTGVDELGEIIEISDPMAETLRPLAGTAVEGNI